MMYITMFLTLMFKVHERHFVPAAREPLSARERRQPDIGPESNDPDVLNTARIDDSAVASAEIHHSGVASAEIHHEQQSGVASAEIHHEQQDFPGAEDDEEPDGRRISSYVLHFYRRLFNFCMCLLSIFVFQIVLNSTLKSVPLPHQYIRKLLAKSRRKIVSLPHQANSMLKNVPLPLPHQYILPRKSIQLRKELPNHLVSTISRFSSLSDDSCIKNSNNVSLTYFSSS